MRLEDKIRPHALLWDCYNDEPEKYNHTNKLIKIADDYAIGFAQHLIEQPLSNGLLKELLEIYKKEKGL
jgi:hypothetical protein